MSGVSEVKNAGGMKILGALLIFFSVLEFGIGGAVYGWMTNVHLGAWWGAICCFIAGVCGVISNGRSAVITGCVFSIFAIIIAIVGAIVDGISAAVFAAEKGCINTETHEGWGTDDGKNDAAYCAGTYYYDAARSANSAAASAFKGAQDMDLQRFYNYAYNRPYSNNNNFFYNHPYWEFYYNVNHFYNWYQTHNTYYWNANHNFYNSYYYLQHGGSHNNNFYYNHPYYNNNNFYYNHPYYNHPYYNNYNFYSYLTNQCVCADGTLCYGYDLASGDNCGTILTTYSDLLSASTAILVVLVLLSFIYSIFTCIACGNTSSSTSYAATATPAPVVVQMAPNPGAVPGYAQPYAPVAVSGYAAYQPQPVSGYVPQPQPLSVYVPQPQPQLVYAAVVTTEGQKQAI